MSMPQISVAPCNNRAKAMSAEPNARRVASLRRFLDTDSSLFEKLILVSYLRDSNGDRHLKKLTREYSYAEVIAGLCQLHMEMFLDWLNMPLCQQQVDIRTYLSDPDDRTRMLASLAETACAAIPPEAKPHETQLFTQGLEIIHVGLGGAPKTCGSRRMIQPESQFQWCALAWTPAQRWR
jgi:hypothetical protein